jgi:hypothetical protein
VISQILLLAPLLCHIHHRLLDNKTINSGYVYNSLNPKRIACHFDLAFTSFPFRLVLATWLCIHALNGADKSCFYCNIKELMHLVKTFYLSSERNLKLYVLSQVIKQINYFVVYCRYSTLVVHSGT